MIDADEGLRPARLLLGQGIALYEEFAEEAERDGRLDEAREWREAALFKRERLQQLDAA